MAAALHVPVLPLLSVTVRVRLVRPASLHVKLVWLRATVATVQLSVLPLSTAAADVLPLPLGSRLMVIGWHTATGATLSTVTVTGTLVETTKGDKVTVFKKRRRNTYRRRRGHRQTESHVKITAIGGGN